MMEFLAVLLPSILFILSVTKQSVADEIDDHIIPIDQRLRNMMLSHCKNITIDCPAEKGMEDISVFDVFDMMAESVRHRLRPLCRNNDSIIRCISGCQKEFRTSKYGHLSSMCIFYRQILWERQCWDEEFVDQARRCVNYHYPARRMRRFYPVPFRVYDRHTIARDCFPDDEPHCQYHKSYTVLQLMPAYYNFHPFPEGFNHLSDYIGFTTYTPDDDDDNDEDDDTSQDG